MLLNEKIRMLLSNNGWTQKDLADILFVSPDAVSSWVRGINTPSLETIKKLSSASTLLIVKTKKQRAATNAIAAIIFTLVSLYVFVAYAIITFFADLKIRCNTSLNLFLSRMNQGNSFPDFYI